MTLTPAAFDLLWPVFALMLLIFVVWFTMVVQRLGHIKRNPPTARDFADNAASGRYFSPVEPASNTLRNLFEMPVLFFAVVLLLLVTRQADYPQVVLAWAYVAFRALHSLIHIGPKNVRMRFMVYLASCAILAAMWIGLFVDLIHAARVLASGA